MPVLERHEAIEPFPWNWLGELADSSGVDRALAEELLSKEIRVWVDSRGLARPDLSTFPERLRQQLQEKVDREGFALSEAALHLGMTEESLRTLVARTIPRLRSRRDARGELRFLKSELDTFTNSYLPRFKTWGTRTNMLREFFNNLQLQTGACVLPQNCDVAECGQIAQFTCANPACRADAPPRKVCPAHREFLHDMSGEGLCAECVRRWLNGELPQYEVAGTRERLEREYRHG
jgi:hypothetical protein